MHKKSIIPILFLLFSSVILKGQDSKYRIGIGVKPMLSVLQNELFVYDAVFFVTPSVQLEYKLTEVIQLNVGLEYERKGGKTEVTFSDNTGNILSHDIIKINLNYLQIPLFATFKTKGKVKVFGNAGLNTGILVNENFKNKTTESKSTTDNFKAIDLSVLLGGGLEFNMNDRLTFNFGPRFNIGIIDMSIPPLVERINSAGFLFQMNYSL
jgi:hypothetical protein